MEQIILIYQSKYINISAYIEIMPLMAYYSEKGRVEGDYR